MVFAGVAGRSAPALRVVTFSLHLARANPSAASCALMPGDDHVFHQPAHRYFSMQRNFDWFNFWLLDLRDSASEKREQYARWERLRISHPVLRDAR